MKNYIQLIFTNLAEGQQEMLIARLSELDVEGFEETENGLNVFLKESVYERNRVQEAVADPAIVFTVTLIPEQNWNSSWESNFEPVRVDDFVSIRAGFHPPAQEVQYEIIITPKMSFGTGHHATTHLMVQEMREIDFKGKTVFDFGTGTGILAILAEMLGAKKILAIDHDDWSISNAAENIVTNHCERIILEKGDRLKQDDRYDIILANINKNVILEHFQSLVLHLAEGGTLLLSGLLKEDEADLRTRTAESPLRISRVLERNNWICLKINH